jgi:hypothetical protein
MSIGQPPPATPAWHTRHGGRRRGRRGSAASFGWAFAPLYTIGLGTWAVFLYAAIRRRSAWLGGASALYAALFAVFVVAESPAKPGPLGSSPDTVSDLADRTIYPA